MTNVELAAQSGLRAIANVDRQFDAGLFIEGGKSAYKLVLEAYWKGDKDTLNFLCDDDVYESFAEAIDGRIERGETLENRLVRIDEARIVDASLRCADGTYYVATSTLTSRHWSRTRTAMLSAGR